MKRKPVDTEKINTTALAFMGDAVYEVFVRECLLASGNHNAHKLHGMAVKYVKASAQAIAIKAMFDDLTEAEQRLVKRARNRRSATKPKNADPVEYKWATAFEALIGKLYLDGEADRTEELMETAVAIIDSQEV